MDTKMPVKDEEPQIPGYSATIIVRVSPEPGTYYSVLDYAANTNDTTDQAVLDEIRRGYLSYSLHKSDPWIEFEGAFADDPDFDDFLKEIEVYRKKLDEE